MANVICSPSVKLTVGEFKILLEEKYKEWDTEETDDYGDRLLVIEEIYVEIFGQEEFDEFIKRIRNGRNDF